MKLKAVLILSVLWCSQSFGWGSLGHETVASLAYRHLYPEAQTKVDQLLAGENFVKVSTWADEVRRDSIWHHTAPYHFANIAANQGYLDSIAGTSAGCQVGDVVQAVMKSETTLRSNVSDQEKNYALKFMIHFVGDMHQPLHTGHPEDRGGNDIAVKWFGKTTNLHAVWDTALMTTAHKADFGSMSPDDQAKWYADYLDKQQQSVGGYNDNIDVLDWITQTLSFLPNAYSFQPSSTDPQTYMKDNISVVEHQLKVAGYRLALLLNSIFVTGGEVSTQDQYLRDKINSLVPNFESGIKLTPASDASGGVTFATANSNCKATD